MQSTAAEVRDRTADIKAETDMEHGLIGCLKKITGMGVQEDVRMQRLASGNSHELSQALLTKKSLNVTRVLQPVHTLRL